MTVGARRCSTGSALRIWASRAEHWGGFRASTATAKLRSGTPKLHQRFWSFINDVTIMDFHRVRSGWGVWQRRNAQIQGSGPADLALGVAVEAPNPLLELGPAQQRERATGQYGRCRIASCSSSFPPPTRRSGRLPNTLRMPPNVGSTERPDATEAPRLCSHSRIHGGSKTIAPYPTNEAEARSA